MIFIISLKLCLCSPDLEACRLHCFPASEGSGILQRAPAGGEVTRTAVAELPGASLTSSFFF